jgi:hypothetical protein
MAFTYSLIASSTVGAGGASSINFTSIPNNYTDLVVKYSLRVSTTDPNAVLRFNGLTSAIITGKTMTGTGSAALSSNYSAQSDSYVLTNPSDFTSTTFSNVEVYIPNYTSSNNKSWSIDETTENIATLAYSRLGGYLWSNTSAINSIQLTGSFIQHSTAYLYGIRAGEY